MLRKLTESMKKKKSRPMIQCCGMDIARAKMRTENQSVHILQCRRKEGAFK